MEITFQRIPQLHLGVSTDNPETTTTTTRIYSCQILTEARETGNISKGTEYRYQQKHNVPLTPLFHGNLLT